MSDRDQADADVLFPDRQITIAGRPVTIHELTLRQSLALQAPMQPVIDALLPHYGADGAGVDSDTVLAALAAHPDATLELLAQCTGEPVDWLATLPEHEGMQLLLLCVSVHVPFFVRPLELRCQSQAQTAALAAARNLASCSPASSAMGTIKPH